VSLSGLAAIATLVLASVSVAAESSQAGSERTFVIGSAPTKATERFDDLAEFNATVTCVKPGDTVLLEAGKTYHGVLRLRACADSGSSNRPITVRSFDPRAPIDVPGVRNPARIDAAFNVRTLGLTWNQVGRDQWPAGAPEPGQDLALFRMGPIAGGEVAELFHDSSRLLLARAPSEPAKGEQGRFFTASQISGPNQECASAVCLRSLDPVAMNAARTAASSKSARGAPFAVVRTSPWSLSASTIEDVAAADGEIRLNHAITGIGMSASTLPRGGFGYVLVNDLAFLDSPGEWYFDRASRMLYLGWNASASAPSVEATSVSFASDSGGDFFTHGDAAISFLGNGPEKSDKYRLLISDLTVVHSVGHGIRIQRAPSVALTNLRVNQSGRSGIAISDVSGVAEVAVSTVLNAADNGILLSSAKDIVIRGNTITDAGRLVNQKQFGMDFNGVRAGGFSRAVVSDNIISETGYAGVMLAEPDAKDSLDMSVAIDVSNNTVSDFCTLLNDCAAIYINGRQKKEPPSQGTSPSPKRIVGNNISSPIGTLDGLPGPSATGKSKSGAFVRMVGAIYLDHLASGYDISGNRVSGVYEPYGWRIFNQGVLNSCTRDVASECVSNRGGYKCYSDALDKCNTPPRAR
jgi:hypothetical protein